jgi:hypothetical protein
MFLSQHSAAISVASLGNAYTLVHIAADTLSVCANYIGPNKDGFVRHARTNEGPSSMREEDEHKYRMLHNGDFEISITPQDAGGSDFAFCILKSDFKAGAGELICDWMRLQPGLSSPLAVWLQIGRLESSRGVQSERDSLV